MLSKAQEAVSAQAVAVRLVSQQHQRPGIIHTTTSARRHPFFDFAVYERHGNYCEDPFENMAVGRNHSFLLPAKYKSYGGHIQSWLQQGG